MKKSSIIRLFIIGLLAVLFVLPLRSQFQLPSNEGVGYRVKQLRQSYQLTTAELAKYTGLSKQYLEGIECGKYAVGDTESRIIGEYFGQEL